MALTRRLSFWTFIVFGIAGTLFSLRSPGAANFASGELAKILFFHLPAAVLTIVAATFAMVWGIKVLTRRSAEADVKMGTALDMGAFFAVYTMASGILFSKSQWGEWWHGDPRQVSFLMVLLILGAGLALRNALTDPEQRARISAAYTVLSYLPIFFLVLVYPRLEQVASKSLHPTNTIQEGSLDGIYFTGVLLVTISLCACWTLITKLRLEAFRRQNDHDLDADSSAPGPVVRPRPDAGAGNP